MGGFKIGDIVSFPGVKGLGIVLLIKGNELLVDVGVGNGHNGDVPWTRGLGWRDDKLRCWFVGALQCTLVKSKVVFRGNVK